jgi:hypothetical protein
MENNMSRRYGRNQKRHHRERIAALESALLETAGLLAFQRNRADRLQGRIEDWTRRIRSVCGDHHPFNERAEEMAVHRIEPYFRIGKPIRFTFERAMSLAPEDATIAYIEAVSHILEIDRQPPAGIPGAVIKLNAGNGDQFAYAVDREFLRQGRRDPEFVRYLAGEISHKLSEYMATAS